MKKVVVVMLGIICLFVGGNAQADCTGTIFSDVNEASVGYQFCDYIERFSVLGITTGYPDGTYRPWNNVNRAQMAAFVMRTIENAITAGSCSAGSAIRQILEDGSVICEVDTDTTYTAGSGLTLIGTQFNVSTPFHLEGTWGGGILRGINTAEFAGSSGVHGYSGATTAAAFGVLGESESTSGTGVYGYAAADTGVTYGVYGESDSTSGTGVYGFASASTGTTYGLYGRSYSTSGRGVEGYASTSTGTTYGVYGRSASTSGTGVYGHATAVTGNTVGLYGVSASTSGKGVYGYATATTGNTIGVYGDVNSTTGIAVLGQSWGFTGVNYGVYGLSLSTSGRGVYGYAPATSGDAYGVYGQSDSTSGMAVIGYAQASTGLTYGVFGTSSSSSGVGVYGAGKTGVYGYANGSTGDTYGVYASSASSSGTGVYGYAYASTGNTIGVYGLSYSTSGKGVYGRAEAATGTTYGVYGSAVSTSGYAGYFNGRVHVAGYLNKAGGGFKIDHPLDPENKYLYHSFVESPDMKNIYDGIAVLDNAGEAWVELPEWFEALNKDFRYQLTSVGAPGPNLYIAVEVEDNRFKVAGGSSGMKVSWQITGTRKDAYAEANPMPVEEMKPPQEQGYYLYPNVYGQPEEKSIEWANDPEGMKRMKEERAKAKKGQV